MVLLKRKYDVKIKNIEEKIPIITNVATNSTLNAKINEIKNDIPNIVNLVTTTALTVVENKIPVTTSDYSKFTNNILDVKITAKNLVNESGLNGIIKTLASKEEIKN